MDRALFEAVRDKSLTHWSHRTVARNKSDQLLTGLLFDDAGHRMIPTHATKADYRYYASAPVLHGEAKTASANSKVTRTVAMVHKETNFLLQLCATSHRVSVAPHIFAELLGGVPTTRDTRF